MVKRILRTWHGRRRDPSPAWARQTAEHSHWLIATSIKANACTVNTNVRVILCGALRLICAKRVLLSVAALLVLAMVLGRVGELAAKRGEQLATRIPRVQRPPNPDIKRARPRIPKEAKPGSSHKSTDNDPPAGQPRRTHAAANTPASRPRRACGKDPPARQPAAAIPNGATWSRGRSPT